MKIVQRDEGYPVPGDFSLVDGRLFVAVAVQGDRNQSTGCEKCAAQQFFRECYMLPICAGADIQSNGVFYQEAKIDEVPDFIKDQIALMRLKGEI